jgi:thioredoxin reductase
MLDWLIIGGGIHGTHLALVLLGRRKVAPERLRILDPHETLLARWTTCTAATGMTYLRSTVVHHLALDPHDLWKYATDRGFAPTHFRGSYRRPSLALFQEHSQAQIAAAGLAQLHLCAQANGLSPMPGGWCVETDQGSLAARRVLLALSVGAQPRWPQWAQALRAAGGLVRHLYDPATPQPTATHGTTVVIGGGISAAQAAVALASAAPGTVTLLMRHAIRIEDFDSPAGWVGPKDLRRFLAEPSLRRRREMIAGARRPGTMPQDVAHRLERAVHAGLLRVEYGEVQQSVLQPDRTIALTLPAQTLHADQVLLATGFEQHRPGGAWLDHAITAHALPVAGCGYPVVSPDLQWAPGLYVTGALAELELGPVARNIAGARHAGERLAAVQSGG